MAGREPSRRRITNASGVDYWLTEEGPGHIGFKLQMCTDGDHPLNQAYAAQVKASSDRMFRALQERSIFAKLGGK